MKYFVLIFKMILFFFSFCFIQKYIFKIKHKIKLYDLFYSITIILIFIFDLFNNKILSILIVPLLLGLRYLKDIVTIKQKEKEKALPIIVNGKVNFFNLVLINKNKDWLIESVNEDIRNISYAFYQKGELFFIKKSI